MFVLAVGSDQGIYCNYRTGETWQTAWTKIPGGQTKNAVAAIATGGGGISAVITGLDGKFYTSWRDPSSGTWTPWASLDNGTGSSPVTVAGAADSDKTAWVLTGNNKHVYTFIQENLIAE
ncbi:hypothetical protein V2S66_05040 [Streptomyces sp. V4-01]|uniref:Uncharacterized protein n=1 Tax=Actinacidiphila polyblastidii TaxID=3110430 RepID=A0ABU7P7V9_9ACTN|nr:hypothetical protein [Streptomyces sp. V4-01]